MNTLSLFPPEPDDSWRDLAACIGLDHLFFLERGGDPRPAQQICADCPVKQPCLDYSIKTRTTFGIWGGMGPEQKKTYMRKRALAAKRERQAKEAVA